MFNFTCVSSPFSSSSSSSTTTSSSFLSTFFSFVFPSTSGLSFFVLLECFSGSICGTSGGKYGSSIEDGEEEEEETEEEEEEDEDEDDADTDGITGKYKTEPDSLWSKAESGDNNAASLLFVAALSAGASTVPAAATAAADADPRKVKTKVRVETKVSLR